MARSRKQEPAAFEKVRKLCQTLPGTSETSSWGHPNFRAGGRAYVTLEMQKERPTIALRLVADQVQELCAEGRFFPTPYGRGLWASTYLDGHPNWRHLQALVRESYRLAVPRG